MGRIVFGVSPIGLGHATRAMVLKQELESRGAEVTLFSGGSAADFMRASGHPVVDVVGGSGPRVVAAEMKWASAWYLRSWWDQRGNVARAEKLLESHPHDLVVCDEEFSGIVAAERRKERRVFISDELELGFARSWLAGLMERRVERWYRRLQDSVDVLVVPEEGEDSGNRRFVGPIVRPPTLTCEEVRSKYDIPEGKMILFSLSGSGVGRELAVELASKFRRVDGDAALVISGNRGGRISGEGVRDLGVVLDNQNLVACADVVVSTAGKSTIDEAAASGTPMIAVPIRHHAEQERNAAALGFSADDSLRLAELVGSKSGRRELPREYHGEKKAADAILSLLA